MNTRRGAFQADAKQESGGRFGLRLRKLSSLSRHGSKLMGDRGQGIDQGHLKWGARERRSQYLLANKKNSGKVPVVGSTLERVKNVKSANSTFQETQKRPARWDVRA